MSTRTEQAMKTTAFNEKGLTPLPWDQPDSSINPYSGAGADKYSIAAANYSSRAGRYKKITPL